MSDAPDPLERELANLRPPGVSPELRQRVGEQLERTSETCSGSRQTSAGAPERKSGDFRYGRLWGLGILCVLAAAVALVLGPTTKKDPPPPTPPVVVPAPPAEIESPDPAPSVLAYQRALARSPDELTALLDRHAAAAPDPVPVAAFPRSNATLDALIGDD